MSMSDYFDIRTTNGESAFDRCYDPNWGCNWPRAAFAGRRGLDDAEGVTISVQTDAAVVRAALHYGGRSGYCSADMPRHAAELLLPPAQRAAIADNPASRRCTSTGGSRGSRATAASRSTAAIRPSCSSTPAATGGRGRSSSCCSGAPSSPSATSSSMAGKKRSRARRTGGGVAPRKGRPRRLLRRLDHAGLLRGRAIPRGARAHEQLGGDQPRHRRDEDDRPPRQGPRPAQSGHRHAGDRHERLVGLPRHRGCHRPAHRRRATDAAHRAHRRRHAVSRALRRHR